MPRDTQTDEQPEIRTGRRVICTQHGPLNGKRGRVFDVMAGGLVAHVDFGATGATVHVDYLEPVGGR